MSDMTDEGLVAIARHAALEAGLGPVDDVKVSAGQDSDERPAYFFTLRIDRDRDPARAGLLRIRFIQKLRDELLAVQDGHYPIIQVVNADEWAKVNGA